MIESGEQGGEQANTKKLFVAVRTMDRRLFVSPTANAPDFFEFDIKPDTIPLEDRVVGMMRTHHGVMVNNDHSLAPPSGERRILGQAVYQRHIVDYERAGTHGLFTPHEVNLARQDLQARGNDESDRLSPEEKRLLTIKVHLFRQVVSLFHARSAR